MHSRKSRHGRELDEDLGSYRAGHAVGLWRHQFVLGAKRRRLEQVLLLRLGQVAFVGDYQNRDLAFGKIFLQEYDKLDLKKY